MFSSAISINGADGSKPVADKVNAGFAKLAAKQNLKVAIKHLRGAALGIMRSKNMSDENKIPKMRPVIILAKGQMSKKDMAKLNDNYFVVVEAEDPSKVRFCEPPPHGYDVQERAALALCRHLLNNRNYNFSRSDISILYCDFLMQGSPLLSVAPAKK